MVLTKLALWSVCSVALVKSESANLRGSGSGECEFEIPPAGVGYYWDTDCNAGGLGCDADGKHAECRLCGAGIYENITCPPSSCHFPNKPYIPYYWDNSCKIGDLGCWADGVHVQCRFCGDFPFTGVPCPEEARQSHTPAPSCAFDAEPETKYFWDPTCYDGKHGCNADGKNVQCRFCGGGGFDDIHCPGSHVCEFPDVPTVPYFWDPKCKDGGLGCLADGVHPECRFCAERPFESVACPEHLAPPKNECTWPQRGEPSVAHFWDETCKLGQLGCWADGIHAECRYCGSGVYANITCPASTAKP